jgi:hypothetical protein
MYMQFGVICLLTAVSQGSKGIMGMVPSHENDGGGQGADHVDILTTRYTNGLLIVDYEAIYPLYTGVKIWLCFCQPGAYNPGMFAPCPMHHIDGFPCFTRTDLICLNLNLFELSKFEV